MRLELLFVLIVIVITIIILVIRARDERHIDVVYSWIDGNNEHVQGEIRKWREIENPIGEASSNNRFKTMDELKYSLRSIYEYAPWVRNIYIITSFHMIPEWFDEEEGKRHGVFFIDDSKLLETVPVFNSLAKEAVKHKIPGLSERYLYFNDDLFFGKDVTLDDFMFPDGKAKMFLEPAGFVPKSEPDNQEDYFARGLLYTRHILLSLVDRGSLHLNSQMIRDCYENMQVKKHTPDLHFVSEDRAKWRMIPDIMRRTANGRFRHIDQLYDNTLFDNYWKLARGKALPSDIRYAYLYISGNYNKERLVYEHIIRERPEVFCVNDGIKEDTMAARYSSRKLVEFLENYFPEPSPWEK